MLGAVMGFEPLTLAAAAVATEKVMESVGQMKQASQLQNAAKKQDALNRAHHESLVATAAENQRRELRNADMQLAYARADAGAANMARDGSAAVREKDLATRLEDDIANRTNAALQNAHDMRLQGLMETWNTRVQAANSRRAGVGSLFSGAANFMLAAGGGEKKAGDKAQGSAARKEGLLF